MKKIDFIGIGAQKSGTSWLYSRLGELPEFFLPLIKEIHYFDRSTQYSSSNQLSPRSIRQRIFEPDWFRNSYRQITKQVFTGNIRDVFWLLKWYYGNYSDHWYLSLFNTKGMFTGEITPSYSMLGREDIKEMYSLAPEAKLIFLVRNPVDRAWSNYRYVSRRYEQDHRDDTIDAVINFIDGEGQMLRSDYMGTIERYIEVFPPDQILIGFYDAISDNPTGLLQDIVKHIGGSVESIAQNCNLNQKNNVSESIEADERVLSHLKDKYHEPIRILAEKFGGYFNKWLYELYNETSSNSNSSLNPTIKLNDQSSPTSPD